jgi:hypothetical protein
VIVVPKLGQLRLWLAIEGLPSPKTELCFNLDTRQDGPAPEVYLVADGLWSVYEWNAWDALFVDRQTCERALAGAFDRYPDLTPLAELCLEPART